MKKNIGIFLTMGICALFISCGEKSSESKMNDVQTALADTANSKKEIAAMLDSFNLAAARSDYEQYFVFFAEASTFLGTDATENWNKDAFMKWAKPYFDKKRTWDFKTFSRNIYFGGNGDIAWFDELLNTQMKICRGSGVVVKQNDQWKIKQYVLSATIPNSQLDTVIKLKAAIDDSLINQLSVK